ncbi:MAG: hypothetical protein E7381_03150 [Clostridiales bacterium]|nr:hypothetical protein [Clostridiales bacterium]
MLPNIQRVKMPENIFPTKWQTVIFRNYGLVSLQNIATVLGCDTKVVEREALRLGLPKTECDGVWEKKGYITIIRNNWFLLPYSQLLKLLNITEEKLDYILLNDDFLGVKLGNFKPECDEVVYAPLTKEQEAKTKLIADMVYPYQVKKGENFAKPFDFFKTQFTKGEIKNAKGTRIVHGYLSPCGDAFAEDSEKYMPDGLLSEYARQGVNGVWLHGLLSVLSPYPFDEKASAGYKERRAEMKKLIARLKKYGLKLYLYLNEPRALPIEKFGKYTSLMGRKENGYAALCFEHKETREYLYNAVKDLLTDVTDLGGIMTITMSENFTHCHYVPNNNCPICKDKPPQNTTAAVNNVIQKAIKDSGSNAELIANLWGWSGFMGWTEDQTLDGVEKLDKEVSVLCVSEYDLPIEKGGVKSRIIDYSISNPGPSEITKKTLQKASKLGHRVYAKIQVNNSWECSAVPYLPVFDLIYEHLQNLTKIGVKDYMLTWTLGGYPSPMLGMVAEYVQDENNFSLDSWYEKTYGQYHKTVKKAVKYFCDAFKEYPFSIDALYFSPNTLGCANFWSLEAEEKTSFMVCYTFDDYETWTKPYPIEIYLSQYEELLKKWEMGYKILDENIEENDFELKQFAKVAYTHFKSNYLQTKFSYLKREKQQQVEELKQLLEKEKANTKQLLELVYQNAYIGFEASNHYFYTDRSLLEKLLVIKQLEEILSLMQ